MARSPVAGHDLGVAAVGTGVLQQPLEPALLIGRLSDRQPADPPERGVERRAERLPACARSRDELGLERARRAVGAARGDAGVALRCALADVIGGLDERNAGCCEREPAGDRTPHDPASDDHDVVVSRTHRSYASCKNGGLTPFLHQGLRPVSRYAQTSASATAWIELVAAHGRRVRGGRAPRRATASSRTGMPASSAACEDRVGDVAAPRGHERRRRLALAVAERRGAGRAAQA